MLNEKYTCISVYQHPRNLMGMTSDVHGISSVNGNAHLLCVWGGGGGTPKLLEGELLKLNSKKSPILKARKNREIIFRGQKKGLGLEYICTIMGENAYIVMYMATPK